MILLPYFSEEIKLTMKSAVSGYESEMLSFCLMNVLSLNICKKYTLYFSLLFLSSVGVKAMPILALGDSLTSGFHSEDKNHTPYAKTLEYLLNKDVHRCYTLTTVARDRIEASEISALLQNHLQNCKVQTAPTPLL